MCVLKIFWIFIIVLSFFINPIGGIIMLGGTFWVFKKWDGM
jgi:hypothetical protein